jgi:hypothetical protein
MLAVNSTLIMAHNIFSSAKRRSLPVPLFLDELKTPGISYAQLLALPFQAKLN